MYIGIIRAVFEINKIDFFDDSLDIALVRPLIFSFFLAKVRPMFTKNSLNFSLIEFS